jgi:uncharacterized DUF497 family protein
VFRWNLEKNQLLLVERGISFEEIVEAICDGRVVSDLVHPKSDRYPNQRLMIIHVNDYTFAVPYVIDGNDMFLKTIIPSRKAHKKYKRQ